MYPKISSIRKVKVTSFVIHSKITRHEEKWENTTHNEEKSQSTGNDSGLTQVLKLSGDNINCILYVQKLIRNMEGFYKATN